MSSALEAGSDKRTPGTPVQQLFKQHQIHSPLQEMDGLDDAGAPVDCSDKFKSNWPALGAAAEMINQLLQTCFGGCWMSS